MKFLLSKIISWYFNFTFVRLFQVCYVLVAAAQPKLSTSTESRKTKMAALQPKNSGGPITKFWEAPETISALEHVKGWLCKHAKKVRKVIVDKKSVEFDTF